MSQLVAPNRYAAGIASGTIAVVMVSLQTLSGRSLMVDVLGRLAALGRITPRLVVPLVLEVTDARLLRVEHLVVRLSAGNELLGTGHLAGNMIHQRHGSLSRVMVEVPTTHRLLDFATRSLGGRGELALALQPYGVVSWGNVEAGDFQQESIPDQGMACQFSVPRSEWYESVLRPLRQAEFVYLEVGIPTGADGDEWRSALNLLQQAEAAWANGDDDAVFTRLRGALDSLPGAKQHILASMIDAKKRDAVDALTKQYGQYLHFGRHIAPPGEEGAGTFRVDHRDAGFAIAQMKMLLTYISQLVVTP